MLFDTLAMIGEHLNKHHILWAVGASLLLQHHDLVNEVNDIDLIVHIRDITKAKDLLDALGHRNDFIKHTTYATTYFYEYTVNGCDVDVMSERKIIHDQGTLTYKFDENAVVDHITLKNVPIPITSLEDWFILYQLISGREKKVQLIEDYLIKNGLKYPQRLKQMMHQPLPDKVIERTQHLLTDL